MHDALGQIPLENDAVHRLGGQPEDLFALRELALGVLALVDVVRGDRDAVDERVLKRGDVMRFEPAARAVLAPHPMLLRESVSGTGRELAELATKNGRIVRMQKIEDGRRLARIRRKTEDRMCPTARRDQLPVSPRDAQNVHRVFNEGSQIALALIARGLQRAGAHIAVDDGQALDALSSPERLDVDQEVLLDPIPPRRPHAFVVDLAIERALIDLAR